MSLQDLSDHTASRLLKYLGIEGSGNDEDVIVLQVKYGFDGTSANSYKQRWRNENGDDSHIFSTCLVPLQLASED